MTSSAEFQAVFQRGKRIERPAFVLLWREAPGPTRIGFAVSRQLRGAVARNRVRRRLREAYRAAREAAPAGGATMVVVGRPTTITLRFEEVVTQFRSALGAVPRSER